MSLPKTLTVTLATHGDVDEPCVAVCPELALSTDGPTVAAALHALARAIEIYETLAQPVPAGAVSSSLPAFEPAPSSSPAAEPLLRPVASGGRRAKRARPQSPAPVAAPRPELRSA